MKNHELDSVDHTILNILQQNAKLPLKEIAKMFIYLYLQCRQESKKWKKKVISQGIRHR